MILIFRVANVTKLDTYILVHKGLLRDINLLIYVHALWDVLINKPNI